MLIMFNDYIIIKLRYKLIANLIPYLSSLVCKKIFFAVCVSYAVKPVKIRTPITLIALTTLITRCVSPPAHSARSHECIRFGSMNKVGNS